MNFTDPTGLMDAFAGCRELPDGSYDCGDVVTVSTGVSRWAGWDAQFHLNLVISSRFGGFLGGGSQNPTPDVTDIRNRVANMVGNSKCADFITNLLNGAAALTGNPAVATDALKLFDTIRGQGGFIYKDNTATFGFQASTISGSLSGGNAQVLLAPPYPNPSGSRGFAESQARIGAVAALHETLHLAGKNGVFSDETFAAVVKGMPGQLPPRGDITKLRPASDYWGGALSAACAPKPR